MKYIYKILGLMLLVGRFAGAFDGGWNVNPFWIEADKVIGMDLEPDAFAMVDVEAKRNGLPVYNGPVAIVRGMSYRNLRAALAAAIGCDVRDIEVVAAGGQVLGLAEENREIDFDQVRNHNQMIVRLKPEFYL